MADIDRPAALDDFLIDLAYEGQVFAGIDRQIIVRSMQRIGEVHEVGAELIRVLTDKGGDVFAISGSHFGIVRQCLQGPGLDDFRAQSSRQVFGDGTGVLSTGFHMFRNAMGDHGRVAKWAV